jgi:hypothetical protein
MTEYLADGVTGMVTRMDFAVPLDISLMAKVKIDPLEG